MAQKRVWGNNRTFTSVLAYVEAGQNGSSTVSWGAVHRVDAIVGASLVQVTMVTA